MESSKKDKRTNLEKESDRVILKLEKIEPNTQEYAEVADNLEKLYKARSLVKERHVSLDTVALIAGNLLGIGLILWYEKADVITSKALGFVIKGRA